MDSIDIIHEEQELDLLLFQEGMRDMSKVHYRNEKDQIIEQLWSIVFRTLGNIDDAGCDWFAIGNITCISEPNWVVSEDPEIARLINAINALKGYSEFIYVTHEDYIARNGEQPALLGEE